MKNISLFLLFVGLMTGCSTMAHADRIYLYKDVNDKNSTYDQLYGYHRKAKIHSAVSVNFSLPTEHKGEEDLWLNFSVGVPPLSGVSSVFTLQIDRIRIRDEKESYLIYLQESAKRRYANKISFSGGEIFGEEPFEFGVSNTFGASFGLRIKPLLPETLYLDYKLRITAESGEEEILEGTIAMEKTSYKEKPKNPFFR